MFPSLQEVLLDRADLEISNVAVAKQLLFLSPTGKILSMNPWYMLNIEKLYLYYS